MNITRADALLSPWIARRAHSHHAGEMAQIQPAEGVADPEADGERSLGRRGSQLLRESVRRSTLSGTHFLRLFLLTPVVIWAVSPVRFFDLHPSMFAAPVPAHETIAGASVMVMSLLLVLPATV